jgi:hypothetical protein
LIEKFQKFEMQLRENQERKRHYPEILDPEFDALAIKLGMSLWLGLM